MRVQKINHLKSLTLQSISANRLRDYLIVILENDQKLPAFGTTVNKSEISRCIGYTRQLFCNGRGSHESNTLLMWAVDNIGIVTPPPIGNTSGVSNASKNNLDPLLSDYLVSENLRLKNTIQLLKTERRVLLAGHMVIFP